MKNLLTLLALSLTATSLQGVNEGLEISSPIAEGLHDPMEIAVAPDGDLFVIEREGRVLRVNPRTGGIFPIATLNVSTLRETDPNSPNAREEGLLGLAIDPAFSRNGRIYLYYSDPGKTLNRLSRFTYRENKIDPASEKMLLEIPIERDRKVCHNAGSLAFGPGGLLFLSTGDNTNPFESDGRAPIDDRPDRVQFDAQRSAGNTNDLRGKVLRIRPTDDGYTIPAGNLFPPGTPKTKPEIYAMGCRNPFRISVDPRKGTVYWGEVGPDGGNDAPRGPRGYDEVNQATAAGNFGWPFVIANNQGYPIVDFTNGKPGAMTDPAKPANPGGRNTGLANLPPARPALIWYPYGGSTEFPVVGSGSRNAMAGPVFYYEATRKWNALTKQDDHTLLTYDWARGRIWKAKLGQGEKLESLEPLAEKLVHPMDLEMGQDGTLWLLEYGTNWYFNKDGRIRRIRPASGNRAPELAVEAVAGQEGSYAVKTLADPDGDTPTFRWFLTTGTTESDLGSERTIQLTASQKSGSELRAVAVDGKGGMTIKRFPLDHDTQPLLSVELTGKPAALGFGEPVAFRVSSNPLPDAKLVTVRARYIPPTGHDSGGPEFTPAVRNLVAARQCLACHQVDQTSVGPRYLDVALRFQSRPDAAAYLAERILKGSTGDWGEVPMPAQAVSPEDCDSIVRGILGLAEGISMAKGSLNDTLKLPAATPAAAPGGAWEITAEATGYQGARFRLPAK